MELSSDTLIYVQSVKDYFKRNQEAKDYFLSNSNEELFFQHLSEIAEKNYKSFSNPTLNREQFELLRKTTIALSVVEDKKTKKVQIKSEEFEYDNGVFIGLPFPNFGTICLN
jgi:hypothetical protein